MLTYRSELKMRKHANDQYCSTEKKLRQKNTKKEETKLLRARRNEWRITQMVLVIFLSYISCYLPITIVKVADSEVKYPGMSRFRCRLQNKPAE